MMGLVLLAMCIVAAVVNKGDMQIVAIGVAVLNGLTVINMWTETTFDLEFTPAGATDFLHFLTSMAGVGLLVYGAAIA